MVSVKIRDLRDGMRKCDVTGVISELSEARSVNLKSGGQARVADAILQDDSGKVKLSLWNEQIDAVSNGAVVSVENGYTNSYQGELRLNVGIYGKLKVIS